MANGQSEIISPLNSWDTQSAAHACTALGANIIMGKDWIVHGIGGKVHPPDNIIDVGNSGTTLYFTMGTAALAEESEGYTVFTGDSQIRRRPTQPLLEALNTLGAEAFSTRLNGCAPLVIKGRLKGGPVHLNISNGSQYLSSLLLNCPLAENPTEIYVSNPVEKPYIQLTLNWLTQHGIECSWEKSMEYFYIKGDQLYHPIKKRIPGDFSSATFFLTAAGITDSELVIKGLDMSDFQADKAVVEILKEMGASIDIEDGDIRIKGGELKGGVFDMSDIPDALPAMAVVGCRAKGVTKLVNVSHARLKETDRIRVMRKELTKMGAKISELPDGLIIEESKLIGTQVDGHFDHRVVMALAVAGLVAEKQTQIETVEAMSITFPNFVDLMAGAGANMRID